MTLTESTSKAADRQLGNKAQNTQHGFMQALLELLGTTTWRDVTVAAVARRVGMSPGSVYQYFDHLDDLALATADWLESQERDVPEHLALVVALLSWENKEAIS